MEHDGRQSETPREPLDYPPCPSSHAELIAGASLEQLVYWKIRQMFSVFEDSPPSGLLEPVLRHVERPLIALVLETTGGNQLRAAGILGCNRNTLRRKLTELSIPPRSLRSGPLS